ncbi:PREDICTED: zinc finger BED domain-containing protein 4-like [Amphimedon queenslandica]|nr:PREDICTED: zinc finger BED domain-containing protein 4-like [Amphimedon queenslandica]|eukprot:XP_011407706.1 PREDICTED: zinc finger BED domain-containing protein 4-like [Amphimedon queenslandica]
MNCGIELTGWNHLPCFAYTLNLVVQDSLGAEPGLSVIKEKCKAIVAHFHRSTKSSEKLRSTQQQLNMPELKLIQDVVTRWNSTYLMFERILSQHEAVTTTLCLLGKAAMCISTEEKESISEALVLLKPFLQATEEISGDKYISISIIIPLTKMLLKATSNGPNVPLRPLLVQELMRRFSQVEQRYTMAVSTLLDPRFKKLAFADSAAVDQAIRRLKSEVIDLMSAVPANDELRNDDDTESASAGPPPTEDSLWASFDRKVCQASSHRTDSTDSFIEVKRYFEAKVIARKDNPLLWWKENGHQFPHVMKVAKKYLAIPRSSVPSERLFSKAGELISQRRSQLKPKNVDMILFLNKNLPLFNV